MPVWTQNDWTVTAQWTQIASTYAASDSPWTALDVHVQGTDVVAEISESPDHTIQDSPNIEILLREGFSSIPLPPFYAVKFRVWEATQLGSSGTIDVTLRT